MDRGRRSARLSLCGLVAALAVALVLGVAPSAHGLVNLVPNPGFETACAGPPPVPFIPCSWDVTGPSVQMSRDTTIFHSGGASMQVTTGVNGTGAVSDCFLAAAGTNAISFWYSTTDPDAFSLVAVGTAYATTDCTLVGSGVVADVTVVPTRDGAWHQATGSFTLPDGTRSMKLFLIVDCAPPMTFCNNSATANFDDVDLQGLLAATLVSFSAQRARQAVVVRWRTGAEINTLGFNVYRQRAGGRRVRANKRVIPALSLTRGLQGGAYSYVDRRPSRRVLRYWLQEIDAAGHRTWHGPVRVGAV
jgi:hypothetical protein